MLDDELDQLLEQWSRRTRLREAELLAMLANISEAERSAEVDRAGPWITFWHQIGRLIRTEQHLADMTILASLPATR